MSLRTIDQIARLQRTDCDILIFGSFLDDSARANDLDVIIRYPDGCALDSQRLANAITDALGAWCDITQLSATEDERSLFSEMVFAVPIQKLLECGR